VTRAILAMLRTSKGPLDGHTLTLRLMAERELNSADKRLTKMIQKGVGARDAEHARPGAGSL
jgi:hypothetical protein